MNKEFAKNYLGLFHPDNLNEALKLIAENNDMPKDWGKSEILVSYYIGYEIMSNFVNDIYKPFYGADRLCFPEELTQKNINVLRFGCASKSSHTAEVEFLKKIFKCKNLGRINPQPNN